MSGDGNNGVEPISVNYHIYFTNEELYRVLSCSLRFSYS